MFMGEHSIFQFDQERESVRDRIKRALMRGETPHIPGVIEEVPGERGKYKNCIDLVERSRPPKHRGIRSLLPTKKPKQGDVVKYLGFDSGSHYGILVEVDRDDKGNSLVKSQFGEEMRVYKHRMWSVPKMYGDQYEILK
jgi:hypothetical protein